MITVERLFKTYRVTKKAAGFWASVAGLFHREIEEVHAVSDLSLSIAPGERVGFLGPNGAGKTTTLKMLSGLLTPTAGKIEVLGFRPQDRPRDFLRQITLVMGQKQQLIWDLPPLETFELNRAVYEIDRAEYTRTLDQLVEMLQISSLIQKPTRQLSLGERMKCELAAALLHQPKVLFLDEPTIGLDVTMQSTVRTFIRAYNENTKAAVILTSHYMDDVQELCPRVIVIDKGKLAHDGALDLLVEQTHPKKRITVHLSRPVEPSLVEAIEATSSGVEAVRHTEAELSLSCEPDQLTATIQKVLSTLPVTDLRVEDPPLEETMRQIFDRS